MSEIESGIERQRKRERKRKRDNEWITTVSEDPEVTLCVSVFCQRARREGRLVAIVLRGMVPGCDEPTLHEPHGVGHPLHPAGGPISVHCRCRSGHPLSQDKLIEAAESGPRNVTVEHLRP